MPWSAQRIRTVGDQPGYELEPLPVRSRWVVNSGYPSDSNNGALWAGRGISSELRGGVSLRWRFLSAAIAPAVIYQQNRGIPYIHMSVSGHSRWLHPWYSAKIDLPQRFGGNRFWTVDPGESYIRIDTFNVSLGISTENLWWGPGIRNSILMSNTAAGFPHVFLGTSQPVDIWLGNLDVEAVWGRLTESDHFDGPNGNERRLLSGLVASFQPRGLPGLYLGFARVYMTYFPEDGLGIGDLVPFFESPIKEDLTTPVNTGGGDAADQLASFFARWVFPESGFEVYGEWAREDHNWDLMDYIHEVDHSQAYLLGFQKVVESGPRWIRLYGELTHLQEMIRRPGRGTAVFYVHSRVRQGYTQRGQLLGASIGPGGSSQTLGADLYADWGSIGVFAERVRRDDMADKAIQSWSQWPWDHDTELTGGLRHTLLLETVDISSGLSYSYRWNRHFAGDFANWKFQLALTWWPGLSRPSPSASASR